MMKQLHWKEPELNVILLCDDVIVTSTELAPGEDSPEDNTINIFNS